MAGTAQFLEQDLKTPLPRKRTTKHAEVAIKWLNATYPHCHSSTELHPASEDFAVVQNAPTIYDCCMNRAVINHTVGSSTDSQHMKEATPVEAPYLL
jgi:hypothetical protein